MASLNGAGRVGKASLGSDLSLTPAKPSIRFLGNGFFGALLNLVCNEAERELFNLPASTPSDRFESLAVGFVTSGISGAFFGTSVGIGVGAFVGSFYSDPTTNPERIAFRAGCSAAAVYIGKRIGF